MARIRILIADDHAVVREGLARLIADQSDMRVAGQAGDGEAAITVSLQCDPHVVLLDMRMPGLGGVAALRRLRQSCPRARVLVLSMYDDPHYVRAALAAGAHAYLPKRASSDELLSTIRKLHAGEHVRARDHDKESVQEHDAGDDALSAREREVMQMVIEGQTSRHMATTLGISKSSVDTYRARVFRKLGVESRAELFAHLARADAASSEESP
jgi:DNA-binding NarL/FixJ family response regulator